jgi:hypothetical protein
MGWMFLRKHAGLALECWFWLSTIGHFEVAGEWQRNACVPPEKSVINMIWLLPSISDWPIIMIRAGGSPIYLMSQFQLQLVVLQKTKQLNLDVKNIFAGSHTEYHWRCSIRYWMSDSAVEDALQMHCQSFCSALQSLGFTSAIDSTSLNLISSICLFLYAR